MKFMLMFGIAKDCNLFSSSVIATVTPSVCDYYHISLCNFNTGSLATHHYTWA